jgi:hypothetical protein
MKINKDNGGGQLMWCFCDRNGMMAISKNGFKLDNVRYNDWGCYIMRRRYIEPAEDRRFLALIRFRNRL